jgi:peptidoglycan hydrolase-like protein with peptidoglycan-binding domain
MKKVLIASGVAVLAFAMLAGAQGYTFNTNLTVGSTGADVVALQTWLMAQGYNIPALSAGTAKGYFGSQTKTAVVAYQAANGIPNTGFVGPLTRGAINARGGVAAGANCPAGLVCTPVNPVPLVCPVGYICTPTAGGAPIGGLSGTDGTLATFNQLSQYSTEEVGDGQKDVKVLGFEAKASKDGDVSLRSMKLAFVVSNSSGSTRVADYISSVSVWLGETKIATASASDFNKDSTGHYSKTVSLNSGAVLKADVAQNIYFTVDGATNLDTGDIDSETITLDVENIRYEDGAGVVSTETTVGDLDASASVATVAFVSFSTSADTELKIMTDSSSPDTGIVVVDSSSNTDNVVLLVGKLRLDGTSDVILDEFPVTLTTDGSSLAAVGNTLTLKIDGKEYSESIGTTTVPTTATITFDNLDLTIDAGDTLTFTILADVNDIEDTGVLATDFDEGDYLVASVSASNRAMMVVENEAGDSLAAGERTGTVTGDAQSFRTEGIALTLVSVDEDATVGTSANDDVGLFTIKYKVTAIGDTMYVSSLTSTDIVYAVDKGGTATSSVTITATLVNNTDTDLTSVGNFMINEGESETFTLSISVPISAASGSGQYRATLTSLDWDTEDDTDMTNTYNSNMDTFKTDYKVLN